MPVREIAPVGADDHALVVRAQRGDRAAFAELYRQHRRGLLVFCTRLMGDEDEAKDVLQATFLKAFEMLPSLHDPTAFRWWILRIARNEIYGLLRVRRGNGELREEDAIQEETPLDRILVMESEIIAQKLLTSLKTEYREVLVLREYERLSYAEIANVTGDTESSVKARIFKARKALAKQYRQNYEGGAP